MQETSNSHITEQTEEEDETKEILERPFNVMELRHYKNEIE